MIWCYFGICYVLCVVEQLQRPRMASLEPKLIAVQNLANAEYYRRQSALADQHHQHFQQGPDDYGG